MGTSTRFCSDNRICRTPGGHSACRQRPFPCITMYHFCLHCKDFCDSTPLQKWSERCCGRLLLSWCLTSTETIRLIRDGWMEVWEEGDYIPVTTRMTPAWRWAAMRAILMFHWLWGTKSQDSVHRPQLLKRRESRSGFEARPFCLPASRLTTRPNRLTFLF